MLTFPTPIEGEETYLIAINASLVPIVSGLLARMSNRYEWLTDADYEQGYNAFAHLRGCMLSCPLSELLESNNRLYRLLDRAYFGTEYSLITNEPLVIEPPISAIPESEAVWPGTIYQLEDARTKLQAIIDKLETGGELDADMLEQLTIIAGLIV
jgi:hypothetical protein